MIQSRGVSAEPRRSRLLGSAPDLLMVAALILAVPFLFYMQRSTGPYLDEWPLLDDTTSLAPSQLFAQFNGHLMFLAKFALALNETIFGYSARGPLRVVSVASHLALAATVYAFLRTRIDRWVALMGAVFVISAGNGWEIVGVAYSFGWMVALAAGICAVIVFERGVSPRDDWLACGLLFAGLLGSGVVYPFIGGLAVQVLWKDRRIRALRATAAPIVFVAAYWLLEARESGIDPYGPRQVVDFAFEALTQAFGMILARPDTWGPVLFALAAALLARAAAKRDRLTPGQVTVLAIVVLFVFLTGFARGGFIVPGSSRYTFTLQILFLLVLGEFARDWRPNWNARAAAGVFAGFAIFFNLGLFADSMYKVRSDWAGTQAYLIAVDRVGIEKAKQSSFQHPFIAVHYVDFQYEWFENRGGRELLPEGELDPAMQDQVASFENSIREGLQ